MAEEKTTCSSCGRPILQRTAKRRNGKCAPCHRNSQKPPEELFEEAVFNRIDEIIEPFSSYKNALADLESLPRGYSLCFAFHYVHADILNGGISQLYGNSTWPLIIDAEEAAREAGVEAVACLLREIMYYYHLKGRSKLKRRLTDEYFAGISKNWQKSLPALDDEYFSLEDEAITVIPALCKYHETLFESSSEKTK